MSVMKVTWGDKLVVGRIEGVRDGMGRSGVNQDGNECPDEQNPQPVKGQGGDGFRPWKREPKTKQPKVKISDELAELGYYARSLKLRKGWPDQPLTSPPHILINISETSLSSLLPISLLPLIALASQHLRRVYPRGTRTQSSNFSPELYWRSGTQVAPLNSELAEV
ncbi:hypothetical protein K443DRAFT_685938 [Laccaria amethystina LaAM-08-1]|uniref:Phosphoinositide phospholipase C n=1 Tax=Laccaria amethystina LaAM-08-1 TaxID=1095629 RepID=A0A0C9X1Q2_9AGAR|nr:hypothetical protein K443DRAFT_685938 [Laccaria amethystina LaAM-08-1]